MTLTVEASDLASYLGADVDEDRADFLIALATSLCSSILDPLPDAAKPVVIVIAARAYANPQAVQQQTAGPQSVSYGGSQYAGSVGGMYLSRADKSTLRRLAGKSNAFSIDMLPADALQHLPPWDRNPAFSFDDEDSSSS